MPTEQDYTKILNSLRAKLARQRTMIEETEQHITAIETLQLRSKPK